MSNVIALWNDKSKAESPDVELYQSEGFQGILGNNQKMLEVFQQIRNVASFNYPVHLSGETGVGKELVAQAIHKESHIWSGQFVPINCGALPEGLVESELFGHVKGSFSGAIRDKPGRFELANQGTIFLDEIADLPKSAQVKLLRFLEEGVLEKVGGEKRISVKVRIISATNKKLRQEVHRGNFREDLYYRLNVIPLEIPPLRDRKSDISLLCYNFLKQTAKTHKHIPTAISGEAMSAMYNYNWPGNIRELQNNICFAVVKCNGNIIQIEDLRQELQVNQTTSLDNEPSSKLDLSVVKEALNKTGGNKAKAARFLGVGRATLYRFLNRNGERWVTG